MEETINVQTTIDELIVEELETLRGLEVGSNEYKTAVDGVTKLIDKTIEISKTNQEFYEKEVQREFEQKLKVEQMKEEKKDRWVKHGLTAAGIVLPLGLTIWGTLKSLKFEETGTVTTIVGRGFINKLLPKK